MTFLSVFTVVSVSSQTLFYLLWGWVTLECRFQPSAYELQEVTLTKLLYLYDPQACGRLFFYNYTVKQGLNEWETVVQWPVKNHVAASYRQNIKLKIALHILWFGFCLSYMMQGHRPCGFYTTMLPFTLTGAAILVVDILNMGFFLRDSQYTGTELDILNYINANNDSIRRIQKQAYRKPVNHNIRYTTREDTTWISLLFAYFSCRGVVFWVVNFWMIKDNYFEGLDIFPKFN